jgi:hypothetical protein
MNVTHPSHTTKLTSRPNDKNKKINDRVDYKFTSAECQLSIASHAQCTIHAHNIDHAQKSDQTNLESARLVINE